MKIGDLLRRRRLEKGWTVRGAGKQLGVSGAAISQWENGGRISTANKINVAALYDIPIAEFFPEIAARSPGLPPDIALAVERLQAMSATRREAYLRLLLTETPPEE